MKILFLDIDGVVNSKESFKKGGMIREPYSELDPYMAFMVGKIQLYTDCKVVLSSSWRHSFEAVQVLEKRICKMFDKTPVIDGPHLRGDEIQEWLRNHPDVKRYAILDDDDDMLLEQLPNFFKTTWEHGLTEEIMNKVIAHLNA